MGEVIQVFNDTPFYSGSKLRSRPDQRDLELKEVIHHAQLDLMTALTGAGFWAATLSPSR